MKAVQRISTAVCRAVAGLAFAVLIFAVLVQVVGRATGASPVWTEELTRFALLFMVAFGAGLSLATRELVNVDAVCDRLPAPWPRRLRLFSSLAVFALAAALLAPSWRFVEIGKLQTSPALGLRMDYAHATTMILAGSLGVFALIRLIGQLRGTGERASGRNGSAG